MIPLSVPNLAGNEWKYVKECLDTNWVSSIGSYVNQFEKSVADFCGVPFAIATSNGTTALHICLLLAGVKRNDLVIVPNITFVASANSVTYTGAEPVFIDIEDNTWQMDLRLLEQFLQEECSLVDEECIHTGTGRRVSAILPVHVLGNMCNMRKLLQIASAYKLKIVEDATEGLGSYFSGKHAGSFGTISALSFNGNKIITTGGGGMILTDNAELAKEAKHITTQAKASKEEYYHDEIGYNYRLVNILAAMGVAQMEQLPGFLKRKKEITVKYNASLSKFEGIVGQEVTKDVTCNYWLYTVKAPRQIELRKFLQQNDIEARPFWVPMNRLPAFKNNIYYQKKDVSAQVYASCISLPCSTGITDAEIDTVIALVQKFYCGK